MSDEKLSELESDIRILKHIDKQREEDICILKNKCEDMNKMNTALEVISLTLEQVSKHNANQDKRQDERDAVTRAQHQTLEEINRNLSALNQSHEVLNDKVEVLETTSENLEERISEAESKHMVDLRDISKESAFQALKNNIVPFGIGAGIVTLIAEILRRLL